MSMLSEQCAELRNRAKELRGSGFWGNDAAMMERAADAIETLRDSAQECASCTERQGYYADAETIQSQQAHIDKLLSLNGELCAEVNAKAVRIMALESLVRDMHRCITHANEADWFYFKREETGCGMRCTVNGEECGLLVLADRMRELGIEEAE